MDKIDLKLETMKSINEIDKVYNLKKELSE